MKRKNKTLLNSLIVLYMNVRVEFPKYFPDWLCWFVFNNSGSVVGGRYSDHLVVAMVVTGSALRHSHCCPLVPQTFIALVHADLKALQF